MAALKGGNALVPAITRHGRLEIMNADQRSQFADAEFIAARAEHAICTSRESNGRWRGIVFGERLWKTIKCEEVVLHACDAVSAAKERLTRHSGFYNSRRPLCALDWQPRGVAYFNGPPLVEPA